jgi:hypothetical protein
MNRVHQNLRKNIDVRKYWLSIWNHMVFLASHASPILSNTIHIWSSVFQASKLVTPKCEISSSAIHHCSIFIFFVYRTCQQCSWHPLFLPIVGVRNQHHAIVFVCVISSWSVPQFLPSKQMVRHHKERLKKTYHHAQNNMSFDPLFLIHHVTTFAGGTIGAFSCSDCCSKLVTVYMVATAGLATRHEQGPCNYRPEHVNIMNEKMWYTGDEQVYMS